MFEWAVGFPGRVSVVLSDADASLCMRALSPGSTDSRSTDTSICLGHLSHGHQISNSSRVFSCSVVHNDVDVGH